ncbi:hypothetical protein CY34DRAFT_801876 [Suillus luteus UH-Slu-Lm8-n1]|uniref:Unplaced genomic scaffold CY34scaffold_45, whole genome shotgun sequence n=1 Tax=Suillus luteus UH-Slu-Lm8-n1 TaxID=930992 RepID=A0A0D0A551_9AGAM|nr:hypothetical protein CY34DRAFT_801876 [Suillus luteus UH-Slu-Lm8-n1]
MAYRLRDLLVTTENKLIRFWPGRPTRQAFLLIRSWNRHDGRHIELSNFSDNTQSMGSPFPDIR